MMTSSSSSRPSSGLPFSPSIWNVVLTTLHMLFFIATMSSAFQLHGPVVSTRAIKMPRNPSLSTPTGIVRFATNKNDDDDDDDDTIRGSLGNLFDQLKNTRSIEDMTDRNTILPRSTRAIEEPNSSSSPMKSTRPVEENFESKFDMEQRIESIKSAVIGALSGGIAVAPVSYFHHVAANNNMAQWEFTTDMAALQAALFAIVYRYAVREDENPMLNQGVVGAFVVVRTLSNIQTSPSCSSVPLRCGEPLGYFNWDMINQGVIQGLESAVLFGATALAMDYAFSKRWLTKFY